MEESFEDVKVLSLREDWPLIPYIVIIMIGFTITIYDFIVWQQLIFQLGFQVVVGILFLIVGGAMRSLPRRSLSAAGFGSIWKTPRLRIVKGHKLVSHGYYKHIRHPIYTGEIFRNYCIPFILSAVWGVVFMTIAIIFLLFRIRIEERMLVEAFGEEYDEYRSKTKKLIPYIY
ncbi:MAG: methyltransferase family protein [Candidatus Thorarchaeota archaeon]